jgi:hypothetical protein
MLADPFHVLENRKGRAMAIEDASFQPWERIVNQKPSRLYGDEDFSIQGVRIRRNSS